MTAARVAVIGVGRIGTVTAVGLAHLGHEVTGIDRSEERVAQLTSGDLPETEPGLRAGLRNANRFRTLTFASAPTGQFDFAFLCVDTPPLSTGEPDLSQVFAATSTAASLLREGGILVTRSTVPVGTGDRLAGTLRNAGRCDVEVVHVPEFLREGRAWEEFRDPDRLVVGSDLAVAGDRTASLFAALNCPVVRCGRRTAELAKYAANAFLATSISFANEMSDLCQAVSADSAAVFDILHLDRRIGPRAYLSPGLGFGGHCLPKDTAALEFIAALHGRPLLQLNATRQVNHLRTARAVAWLRTALGGLDGRTVCIAGLAFKPETDDLRESPSLQLARLLAFEGAEVTGWDRHARADTPFLRRADALDEAIEGADALVVTHAWAGWRDLLKPDRVSRLMRGKAVFDAPGVLDVREWQAAGFHLSQGVPVVCAADARVDAR